MWLKIRLFFYRLLPSRTRLRLLNYDLEQLEKQEGLPPASDIMWVDDQEEIEQLLFDFEKRHTDGLRRTN